MISPDFDENESAGLVELFEADPVLGVDLRLPERDDLGVRAGGIKLEEHRVFGEHDRVLQGIKS